MAWLLYKAATSIMSKGAEDKAAAGSIYEFSAKGMCIILYVPRSLIFKFWASVGKNIIIYFFSDIDGNETSLEKFRGHVCVIVNVASKWGKTDVNYKQLVEMYKTFSEGKYWMIWSDTSQSCLLILFIKYRDGISATMSYLLQILF